MTNYGTIPTSSSAGASPSEVSGSSPYSNLAYISRAKDRIKDGLGTMRPWKLMLELRSIGLPANISDALGRLKTNSAYFRMNYAIIVLGILFLSLLWNPISLIVFIASMAAWLFLYFLRDEPLVVFGKLIDDRAVLTVLSVVTVVLLFLTDAFWNILGSLLIGAAVVSIHGVARRTDDLFMDEDSTGFLAAGGGGRASS
ncbi:PRA1 family protein F2 [Linum perenne]